MEVGLNIPEKDDWYDVRYSIIVLLKYWPYKELDLTTLTNKRWFQVVLTHLVLKRLAAQIDSDALENPCQLTEFVMKFSSERGNF